MCCIARSRLWLALALLIPVSAFSADRRSASIPQFAHELETATSGDERRCLLALHPDLVTAELTRVLYSDALLKTNLGEDDAAGQFAEVGLGIARQIGDRGGESLLLGIEGIVLRDGGDTRNGVLKSRDALTIAQEVGDIDILARALINLGRAIAEDDHAADEPARRYRRVVDIQGAIVDRTLVVRALHNIGNDYVTRLTDLKSARPYYERAGALARQIGDAVGESSAEIGLAITYQTDEDCGPASTHLQRALRVQPHGPFAADTLGVLAECYTAAGDLARAARLTREAIAGLQADQFRERRFALLNNLAKIHHRQHRDALALDESRRGFRGLLSIGWSGGTVLPQLLLDLGRYPEAVEAIREGSPVARRLEADTYVRYETLLGIADRKLGRVDEATAAFKEAIRASEALRPLLGGDELQDVRQFETLIRAYREAVDLFVDARRNGEALHVAELQKGRGLLNVVKHGRPSLDAEMDGDERAKESDIRRHLTALNRQIADGDPKDVAALQKQLESTQAKYDAFVADVYAKHPRMKIGDGSVDVTTADAMSARLPARTAFIEYVAADESLDAIMVLKAATGDLRISTARTPLSQPALRKIVARFSKQLAHRDLEYRTTARQLYRSLIAPFESQLQGVESICVMPDDALWQVPFEALIDTTGKYLIERAAVFYVPSISAYLAMMSRDSARASVPLLALGNPASSSATRAEMESFYRGITLGRLPDAEREVKTVGAFYGRESRVYTGLAASESIVKTNAPRARVLHFATHAILDDHSPMFSRIMLADDPNPGDDGILEAWEVMNMHLNADLVVLSACHTAGGRVGGGEGIIGMTWAFFAAGARSVVASHWNVSSASTSDMMIAFHKGLFTPGASIASALRTAKLSLVHTSQYAHPFYWAPFVLLGADR
jgi:CHAT domain-containing protein